MVLRQLGGRQLGGDIWAATFERDDNWAGDIWAWRHLGGRQLGETTFGRAYQISFLTVFVYN